MLHVFITENMHHLYQYRRKILHLFCTKKTSEKKNKKWRKKKWKTLKSEPLQTHINYIFSAFSAGNFVIVRFVSFKMARRS